MMTSKKKRFRNKGCPAGILCTKRLVFSSFFENGILEKSSEWFHFGVLLTLRRQISVFLQHPCQGAGQGSNVIIANSSGGMLSLSFMCFSSASTIENARLQEMLSADNRGMFIVTSNLIAREGNGHESLLDNDMRPSICGLERNDLSRIGFDRRAAEMPQYQLNRFVVKLAYAVTSVCHAIELAFASHRRWRNIEQRGFSPFRFV